MSAADHARVTSLLEADDDTDLDAPLAAGEGYHPGEELAARMSEIEGRLALLQSEDCVPPEVRKMA